MSSGQSENKIPVERVKSKKASKEDLSWLEFSREYQQNTSQRLENASKFLSGMIIVFHSLGNDIVESNSNKEFIIIKYILVVLSLLLSVLVFIPSPTNYNSRVAISIKSAQFKIAKRKYYFLMISLFLFLVSIIFQVLIIVRS
ncbi:MAG: hypothetical protein Sapg2KO_50290 [Saprospiraceae bacterium]